MWFAVTAHPVKRLKKHERKEYSSYSGDVVLSAQTFPELEIKLKESIKRYPDQTRRYLAAGIKIVEARSAGDAKRKSRDIFKYFTETGQYGFF
jgi:hypothetical protein